MMNLALMNRFFLAVDKDGRSPISDALLSRWDVEGLATHCRSSENFAWRVGERGEETYFLRFNHATERNVEAIDGELAFVEHLASLGLPVARPIASSAGFLVETIETELGVFHGSLLTALHGDEPDAEQLDLPSLEVWGRLVARVHTASQGFTTAGRKTWKEALQAVQQITPHPGHTQSCTRR